jgi:hypothetical protein
VKASCRAVTNALEEAFQYSTAYLASCDLSPTLPSNPFGRGPVPIIQGH